MTGVRCDEFSQLAPEVALGLLAGDERAEALGHLAGCPACREHLEGLMRVADALLLLAPPSEPAIGFETRVMERLGGEGAFEPDATGPASHPTTAEVGAATVGPRRRWRAVSALAAAAAIVVAVLSGLVTGQSRGRTSAQRHQAAAAQQLAARTVVVWADRGTSTCQLVAFPATGSQPARLVVQLDEPSDPRGSYQVLAEPAAGGAAVPIGTITVVNGQGMLNAAVPAGTGAVHAIRVLDPGHGVKYRATFLPV